MLATLTKCSNCGETFRPKRATARYCGDRCRKAASRGREGPRHANSDASVHLPTLSVTSAPGTLPRGRLSEEKDDYPHVVTMLDDGCRVIECKNDLQWIVQRRGKRADSWRGVSFCGTRAALIGVCGFTETTAPRELVSLPDNYRGALDG